MDRHLQNGIAKGTRILPSTQDRERINLSRYAHRTGVNSTDQSAVSNLLAIQAEQGLVLLRIRQEGNSRLRIPHVHKLIELLGNVPGLAGGKREITLQESKRGGINAHGAGGRHSTHRRCHVNHGAGEGVGDNAQRVLEELSCSITESFRFGESIHHGTGRIESLIVSGVTGLLQGLFHQLDKVLLVRLYVLVEVHAAGITRRIILGAEQFRVGYALRNAAFLSQYGMVALGVTEDVLVLVGNPIKRTNSGINGLLPECFRSIGLRGQAVYKPLNERIIS